MVELRVNGNIIELPKKGDSFKLTRQIADVFDLASVSASYSNSFSIPKTPSNTRVFQYLGLAGDTSSVPYTKNEVNVKYAGFDTISKGWLKVSETTEEYKCSIIDGMVDFFKDIENKTLGSDLDLSNFDHIKNIETVIDSYSNEYYSYIIADYGARTEIPIVVFPLETAINIDPLVTSFSVKKLYELIMSTFGYTSVSDEMDAFINDLYITYPTPPVFQDTDETVIAELDKELFVKPAVLIGDRYSVPSENFWTTETISEGSLINNWSFVVPENSGYRVDLKNESYVRVGVSTLALNDTYVTQYINRSLTLEVVKNGTSIFSIQSDPLAEVTGYNTVFAQQGDIIQVNIYYDQLPQQTNFRVRYFVDKFHHKHTELKISKINQGEITPLEAFKSFKITDFFKELLYRTGLTPLADNVNKIITFIPISQRIDKNNAIDWSSKYIGRSKENYIKGSYAQRNLFKMKYNDDDDNRNDGVLNVNNKNIEDEKTLVNSMIYSPIDGVTEIHDTGSGIEKVPIITMWQAEVSKNEAEETTISYKPYDNRFYFLRRVTKSSEWKLKSEFIPGVETVNQLWFASTDNTLLGQLLTLNFSEYNKIFQNFRSHDIELALGLSDILSLDLTRPYFFDKESAFYIINKITYEQRKPSMAECVKINVT